MKSVSGPTGRLSFVAAAVHWFGSRESLLITLFTAHGRLGQVTQGRFTAVLERHPRSPCLGGCFSMFFFFFFSFSKTSFLFLFCPARDPRPPELTLWQGESVKSRGRGRALAMVPVVATAERTVAAFVHVTVFDSVECSLQIKQSGLTCVRSGNNP